MERVPFAAAGDSGYIFFCMCFAFFVCDTRCNTEFEKCVQPVSIL